MIINPIDLKNATREDLVNTCQRLGIPVHHKMKDDTLRNNIMQNQTERVQNTDLSHVSQRPVAPVQHNTKEMVLEKIKHLTDKEGFEANFNSDDNTWHFKYKGAEDCGNLDIPLRVIVQKANFVAQGRRTMPNLGRDIQDATYAGLIMAG